MLAMIPSPKLYDQRRLRLFNRVNVQEKIAGHRQ